jgi:lathosterol oxidase
MEITIQAILDALLTIFSVEAVRYLIAVLLVMAAIYGISRSAASRRLHAEPASREQKQREFFYSMLTCLVFGANGLFIFFGMQGGWVKVYEDINLYGLLYLPFSLIAMVVAHDAYFYWTHRMIHHRLLFPWVHRIHHKSVHPTAWAAYAFAPAEAFINGLFVPLWVYFVPTYSWIAFVFLAHMILRNAMGHSGFELFPLRMPGSKYFGFVTNVFHHDLHHCKDGTHHFGLYFTWWDRWMGTEYEEYSQMVASQRAARQEVPAT